MNWRRDSTPLPGTFQEAEKFSLNSRTGRKKFEKMPERKAFEEFFGREREFRRAHFLKPPNDLKKKLGYDPIKSETLAKNDGSKRRLRISNGLNNHEPHE